MAAATARPGSLARRSGRVGHHRDGRVAGFLDGFRQFLRIRRDRLYLHPMRGQVDGDLGVLVRGPQGLGDGAGAMAAGHVVDFESDHRYLQWDCC